MYMYIHTYIHVQPQTETSCTYTMYLTLRCSSITALLVSRSVPIISNGLNGPGNKAKLYPTISEVHTHAHQLTRYNMLSWVLWIL